MFHVFLLFGNTTTNKAKQFSSQQVFDFHYETYTVANFHITHTHMLP